MSANTSSGQRLSYKEHEKSLQLESFWNDIISLAASALCKIQEGRHLNRFLQSGFVGTYMGSNQYVGL